MSVENVRFKPPLQESIGNDGSLLGKGAKKVDGRERD